MLPRVFLCARVYTRLGYAEGSGARTKKALVHEANYNSSLIKCDNYDSASWYKTPFWLHHPFLSHAFSSCHLLFPSFRLLPFFCKHANVSLFLKNMFHHFPPLEFTSTFKGHWSWFKGGLTQMGLKTDWRTRETQVQSGNYFTDILHCWNMLRNCKKKKKESQTHSQWASSRAQRPHWLRHKKSRA